MLPPRPPERGRSTGSTGKKQSSSCTDTELPPNKRTCSSSPTKAAPRTTIPNRIHRRVIVHEYGTPIYRASSRVAMLDALVGCIKGYEDLDKKAHLWHCDISIGSLMMNEDDRNPSWRAFLIDLDLAVRVEREEPSGARGKTGTRAFMAIGALLDEKRTFMHDLESFFWVLFWICTHYTGPDGKGRVVPKFDKWNFVDTDELAKLKLGTIANEGIFRKTAEGNFTTYYQPLVPWVNRLRKAVFPGGGRWEKSDSELYMTMKRILREAQEDPKVRNPQ